EAMAPVRPERQLPLDDVVADAGVAVDGDLAVARQLAGRRGDGDDAGVVVRAGTLGEPHRRIGEAVILDFVERGLAWGLRDGAIERRLLLQRQPVLQLLQMVRR